jgi:hypothetical protein
MSQFAVYVMISMEGGRTHEATKEVDSIEEALVEIRNVATSDQPWRAVTLFHVEDLLPVLEGSEHLPAAEDRL